MSVAVAATGVVATVDPLRRMLTTGQSHCLMYREWGVRCPLCGMTRASVALLHGHVVDALRLNVLAVPYLVFLGWALISVVILGRPLRGARQRQAAPVGVRVTAALVVLIAFTVARGVISRG